MTGSRFFKVLLLAIPPLIWLLTCSVLIGGIVYHDYTQQKTYQQKYGEAWKTQYEKDVGAGSVELARRRMIVSFVAVPGTTLLLWLLVRQIRGKENGGTVLKGRKSKQKNEW